METKREKERKKISQGAKIEVQEDDDDFYSKKQKRKK